MRELFVLRRKNVDVAEFAVVRDAFGTFESVDAISALRKDILPLGIQNGMSIRDFLSNRVVPRNRENRDVILRSLGLPKDALLDLGNIVKYTKSLSLIDDFWVAQKGEQTKWEDVNFFENSFSTAMADIAFTGVPSSGGIHRSPEYTTNGMLPKSWRRMGGEVYLYKGGTRGGANTGNEPYAEFYAAQIAERMGFAHIPYNLSMWHGRMCSVCPLMTSADYSLVPVYEAWYKRGNFIGEISKLDRSGSLYGALVDLIVFDAVIRNTDRHLGNFGFLQDNNTLQLALSPIYDNGLSLWCYNLRSDFNDDSGIKEFFLFTDQVVAERIKSFMLPRHKAAVRKLVNFRFERHKSYNWEAWRLREVERFIAERVKMLLS